VSAAPVPLQPPAPAAESASSVPAAALAAVLAGLDGNDRIRLLDRLADTDPAAVEAGLWWLADWHADTRERRRIRNNRSGTLRDRRRRAAAADGGG
jgi:hypothetical protein